MKNTSSILILSLIISTTFIPIILFSQSPKLTLQTGHSDKIITIAISDDGSLLASAGKDNTIIIWDYKLGKEIQQLKAHTYEINTVLFIDNDHLISGSSDSKIIIWDLNKGLPDKIINCRGMVYTFNLNQNKDKLIINSTYTLSIYNIKTGELYDMYNNIDICGNQLFLNNSDTLVFSKYQKKVKGLYEYNLNNKEEIKINNDRVSDIVYKNGFLYYAVWYRSIIIKYNLEKRKKICSLPGDYLKYKFTCIAVSNDDSILVAGNQDKTVYIYSNIVHKRIQVVRNLPAIPSKIIFDPENKNKIIIACDKNILVWNIALQKFERIISSSVFPISSSDLSNDGKQIVFSSLNNKTNIYNLAQSPEFKNVNSHNSSISGVKLIKNDTSISVGYDNFLKFNYSQNESKSIAYKVNKSKLALIDRTVSGVIPLTLGGNFITLFYLGKSVFLKRNETLNTLSVSNDKSIVATGGAGWKGLISEMFISRNFPIYVYNTYDHKLFRKFYGHYSPVKSISFNKTNTLLASCAEWEHYLKIWDIHQGKLKQQFYTDFAINSLLYNKTNDTIFFNSNLNIFALPPNSDTAYFIVKGRNPLTISQDGKYLYFQNTTNNITKYEIKSKTIIDSLYGHNDLITSSSISDDGKRLLTSSWDGTIKLWNTETCKEIATLISINNNDFIIMTPDNYYFATKKAKEEIGFTLNNKFYPFEQFDLKNNRPDIILERIGLADSTLINAYKKAYFKRLKKMNFNESMFNPDFHLPELKILNSKSNLDITNNIFNIEIEASDNKYNLDRINIWLNNVPVYGTSGINLRNEKSGSVHKTVSLELMTGINKIQISCLNEKGVESLKESIEINHTEPAYKPDLYLITIGTSNYIDSRFNLNFAAKDAEDIANLFKNNSKIYKNVYQRTLTNNDVTKENIVALKEFIAKAGVNDIVMIFVSGHGVLDNQFDYYFGTFDIDFNNPSDRGLEYSEIEALLDGIKAIKKILFMDTCHSGEVEKEDIEIAQNLSTEFGDVKFRNAGISVRNKSGLGINNTTEIMKELFTDLRTGTGSTVISSSSGVEYSMESDKWKNGLFTFCVINGILSNNADINKDGEIMLSELQDYVKENVSSLSGGKQIPTNRIENLSMNFRIW